MRVLSRIAFVAACLLNLYAVYWPTEPGPSMGIPHIDKVAHFTIFALVAVTGRWTGVPLRVLAPVLVVQAIGSEIVQGSFESTGRDGDPFDATADLLGVAAGLAGWEWWARRRTRAGRA